MAMSKYADQIKLPKEKNQYNTGLTSPSASFMEMILGKPRLDGKYNCEQKFSKSGKWIGWIASYTPLQNPSLQKLMKTDCVGPQRLRVTGLNVAINSLKKIMVEVNKSYPDVYNLLSTDGMLCPRYMNVKKKNKDGDWIKPSKLSNHSWGCAIDLRIDGVMDNQGDNVVLRGLELIAPIFNQYGWVWGGAYMTAAEDGMHFEVSKETLLKWKKDGLLFCNNDLAARIIEGQQAKPTKNPLTTEQPAPPSHFKPWYKQTPMDTNPSWYGSKGWVTKVRSKLGWFR